jgi:hypothetical protein
MTISTSPNFEALRAEYGGGYPIYLTNYRRGFYTPAYAWGNGGYGVIPDGGTNSIDLGVFRNRQAIRMTIGDHAGHGVNIRGLAAQYGYAGGPAYIELTINPGVYVFGPDTNTPALRTDNNWGAGTSIFIINNGIIVGRGGAGGAGSQGNGGAGGGGGPAFVADYNCIIQNGGIIAGGGGGGGGGGAGPAPNYGEYWGCGGGGGRVHGAGGGSTGGGRNGGSADYGSPGQGGQNPSYNSGAGGQGGNLGENGAPGANSSNGAGGGGGQGGVAIHNNGAITWVPSGDIRGRVL